MQRKRRQQNSPDESPPLELVVRFQRISPTHHRLQLLRADGSQETHELETRSCLLHDLVHFALETEARLTNSLYGRLARGVAYESLSDPHQDAGGADELVLTEGVVGPLQGAWRAGLDSREFLDALRSYRQSIGETCPAWLDVALLARVAEQLRRLEGRWRATPFGEVMELRFPVPAGTGDPRPS